MLKRTSKAETEDINLIAAKIVGQVVGSNVAQKNQAAVELGRLGGLKGGRARADKLSPERRKEIARKAARARWEKRGRNKKPLTF
jgi:hypothetical protein